MKKTVMLAILYMASVALLAGGAGRAWGIDYCVYPGGTGLNDLQNALNAAAGNTEDDVIEVVQGIYTGNFTYNSGQGYSITLEGGYTAGCVSRVCNPTNTVLDGSGSGRVLLLMNTAGGDVAVSGFTIQNGNATNCCGGIDAISQSSSTAGEVALVYNIITGNNSDDYGGGACATSYGLSGGTAGDVILLNNIITGNTADNYGGGVSAASFSITGTAGTITVTNNTITDNDTEDDGGGIYFETFGSSGLVNVYNNIVWGNTATGEGDDVYLSKGTGTTAYAHNNDFSTPAGDSWDQNINTFNLDPLFVDPGYWDGDEWVNGDYHLLPGSPCIDTGDNGAPALPAYDFEGDDRVIDGDNDSTATVDRGADEYVLTEETVVLHKDGAFWSPDTGWDMDTPPYYPDSNYAVDLEYANDGATVILHRDGALWSSDTGWNLATPPYYPGSDYARALEIWWWITAEFYAILHKDGAIYHSKTGWNMDTPPYYPGADYARDLEFRQSNYGGVLHLASYILHQDGALWNSDTGWNLATPPYYAGTGYAVDMECITTSCTILHRDGALWYSDTGWVMSTPPYYAGSDYARDVELLDGGGYAILHKDGALYDSVNGWNMDTPPYYPGSKYARDLEVR